ncbi:M48 family metalloprotease [Moheibacter sediminis]|uniref:Peptidase family M48 n=1 Tax=Moheibacter sediminis TaxID=1434700 RepID=A0A1W2C307_9FLAO|nr:M48 family metalloprotease [Moheibacter sediminis]SMC79569.1 Peptidase family M48 [Moheibacter sediminis]
MKFKFSIVFFLILFQSIFAQNYTPIDTADENSRKELVNKYNPVFENFNSILKNQYTGKQRNQMLNIFIEIQEDFVEEIEQGYFTFDEQFQKMADGILNELKSKNPEISDELKILVSKHGTVNGYCMADGTLVINMGTFKFLENEDQIAGIVAHEIAHKTLNHVTKSVQRHVSSNISETNQGKINSIKKKKIGKNEEAFQLMRSMMYEEGSLRRKQEIEADSLGYMYFSKTKYDKYQFVEAFKLLQRYDTLKPAGVEVNTYKKYFDFPAQQFKEDWMKMEDFSAYDYEKYVEKINKDSISSHPEVIERIDFMERKNPELQTYSESITANSNFLELQYIAEMEEVPNLYFLKQYGLAIYFSLYYLQQGKDEGFYKYWLGKSFEKIHEARRVYKVNRYLDTVSPKDQSESYMQFLNFMWNLNLNEIKNIADFYSQSQAVNS